MSLPFEMVFTVGGCAIGLLGAILSDIRSDRKKKSVITKDTKTDGLLMNIASEVKANREKKLEDFKFGPYRTGDHMITETYWPKKKPEVIEWNYDANYVNKGPNYVCPKCRWGQKASDTKHPKICSCDEYEKDHFHFLCNVCKFNPIMRTADDVDKKIKKEVIDKEAPG